MVVFVPTFVLTFGRGILIPVLPLYADSFNVSLGLVGLALASQGIGNIVGDIPAGIFLRNTSERRVMQVSICIMAATMVAAGLSSTLWQLIIYCFLAGIGMAFWNISRHTYVTRVTTREQRGRAIAILGGVSRIGTFAGPVFGGYIADSWGLRSPLLIVGIIIALIIYFPIKFAGKPSVTEASQNRDTTKQSNHGSGHGLLHHLDDLGLFIKAQKSVVIPAGLGQLLAQMIRAGRQVIIPLYGANVIGLDVVTIGWFVTIVAAIDMSLFPVAGLLMDRVGRKYAYMPSFIIQGIGMAFVPLTITEIPFLLAASLIGLGNGLGSGTMMTLGADLAPSGKSMSEFLGFWRLIGDLGQSGGPIVVGSMAAIFGLPVATFMIAVAGLTAGTMLGVFGGGSF
ncbi:MFS transporter [Chloroflexi bacterium TSY]|nr:MFS transporter [Chloroflexi bacterium TSY]